MRPLLGWWLAALSTVALVGCVGDDDGVSDAAPDAGVCVSSLSFSVVATGLNLPRGIALDQDNVYWADMFTDLAVGGGRIYSAPKDGSAPATMLFSVSGIDDFDIRGLTVHGGALYWIDHRYLPGQGALVDTIRTMPVTGGAPTDLASSGLVRFIVDDDGVFFSTIDAGTFDGVMWHVPAAGGAVTRLGTSPGQFVSFAADTTDLFGTTVLDGLWRMDKGGGDPVTMVPGARGNVFLHDADVYWTEPPPGFALRRVAKAGGAPQTMYTMSGGPFEYYGAVADRDSLLLHNDLVIDRLPLAGGPIERLLCPADGLAIDVYGVAVDATHVYVLYSRGQGATGVMRAPRG